MTTFFFFMPALLLSGLMFPLQHAPSGPVAHLSEPHALFFSDHPGHLPQGVGADILWPHIAALAVLGLFTLGSRREGSKRLWPDIRRGLK